MTTTEPPLEPRRRGFQTGRLEAFSDGVFAIAVTLLVLDIAVASDAGKDLLGAIGHLWPSYLAYVLTFMLVGQVWANHHVMFDQIRTADRVVLLLNTLLLMDIAFLPFAASVLAIQNLLETSPRAENLILSFPCFFRVLPWLL